MTYLFDMSIELVHKDQLKVYKELIEVCMKIESVLMQPIEPDDPSSVERQLAERISYLGYTSRMMEQAIGIYDHVKGLAVDLILQSPVAEMKQSIQKNWFDGKLARYSALYARVENLVKDLRNSIEGLRSILSYEKELIREQRLAV